MTPVKFPCEVMPAEPVPARLMGLYPQLQEGRWMQRARVPGGALSADQWRALAAAARRCTPGAPLHLTTRQDVELHDLAAEQIPGVQRALAAAGLSGLGACGDTLRNITVCPCSGIAAGKVDLLPLAHDIQRLLQKHEWVFALPRKFKISLSACESACAAPWINDLGFVAGRRDGRRGFQVMAGGSLGPKPATGTLLFEWLPAEEVLPLVLAAVRVFAAHGDREHRHKARLRHVRERLGQQAFAELIAAEFDLAKGQGPWASFPLSEPAKALGSRLDLTFPNGDVTPPAAEALAELAGREDIRVRITPRHRVAVWARDESTLAAIPTVFPSLREAAAPQASVVACPGRRWCSRALTDTVAMADQIRADLGKTLSPDKTVCISGCPNGCAHSTVADIGLVGCLDSSGGAKRDAYDLYQGGGMGTNDTLAQLAARKVPPADVPGLIRGLPGRT